MIQNQVLTLFNSQATDGNSGAKEFFGGSATFAVAGTFGGGTCKLQYSLDLGNNWIDIPNTSFTSNSAINFRCSRGLLRAVLSGAVSPSLSAWVGAPFEPDV